HYYGMSESKLQNPNLEKNYLDNNELINESTENFVHNNKRSDDKDYFQIQKEILNDLDNGDASLLNDESTNDSEEVVTEQSNNDEASSKTYQTLYSKQDNNDIKGKVSNTPSRRVPYMEVVGQVHGTYIIAQNENGMFMIDQHAAQERIKYEYFREKIGEVTNEVQDLLIPLTFHFSKDEQMIIDQYQDELDKVGVHLEHFGGHDYIVNSYPVWFPKAEAEEIIQDMVELVLNDKKVNVKKLREDAAIMMSCKKSIKANHYLKNNEMADLIDQLREAEDPFTCPHGRPIIINFSNYELEKLFKRVM
ncbi:DNA mismatch repair protein MutL, partial [Staphylococcus haemolyticus]|nr:DNA mismatch repair protein MutL [Staphylococcus haemolyticus]